MPEQHFNVCATCGVDLTVWRAEIDRLRAQGTGQERVIPVESEAAKRELGGKIALLAAEQSRGTGQERVIPATDLRAAIEALPRFGVIDADPMVRLAEVVAVLDEYTAKAAPSGEGGR